jgi:two-component system OmpR family response regulator
VPGQPEAALKRAAHARLLQQLFRVSPDTEDVDDAARVLVVEDEPSLRTAVTRALRDSGYAVLALDDGDGFAEVLVDFRPDLALLDVMLPGRNGFELARQLRSSTACPVIFMTARDDVRDRLTGFEVGADDYVVKPFVLEELLARVTAVLRRSGRLRSQVIQVDDLIVDEPCGTARRGGAELGLTATELRLLGFLARHRGRTVSKTQILTQVWGYDDYDPNLVEVHVSALRRKLEAHGPRLVHTVRSLGYVLRPGSGAG